MIDASPEARAETQVRFLAERPEQPALDCSSQKPNLGFRARLRKGGLK